MAERLGKPLLPWQQLVADVGGEIDRRTGLPAFREVIVTVPRQSGKTTLILSWEIQRALGWDGPQRIVYSAQDGTSARKKLIDDQAPIIEPLKAKLGVRRILKGMGGEAVEFRNGSRIALLASTEASGHGRTVDLAVKDELFADKDDRREQQLVPAMATRAAGQILTASTMGTEESIALNRAVERGRAAVAEGQTDGVAYFEWSANEADDPDDPAVWWSCMPALGFTIQEATVRHARSTMSDGEFRRAFLNVQMVNDERLIPARAWDGVCSPNCAPDGQVLFTFAVSAERDAASIAAVSADRVVEIIEHRAGTGWLPGLAAEITAKWGSGVWWAAAAGPEASLVPDLQQRGLRVETLPPADFVKACGAFYDAVADRTFKVRRHPALDAAVASASRRLVGDAWAWVRRGPVDISPLAAVTVGLWVTSMDGPSVYESRGLAVL